jgi:hypothetical protein
MKTRLTGLVTGLALCMLLGIGVVSSTQALPPGDTGHDDQYFSDDTYTEMVGERYMECNSGPANWGVRTAFVQSESWGCQESYYFCGRYECHSGPWYDPIMDETFYSACAYWDVCHD